MKVGVTVKYGPRKTPLHFGVDPNHRADTPSVVHFEEWVGFDCR